MISPICMQFSPSPGLPFMSLFLAAQASSRQMDSSVGTIQPLSRGVSLPCPLSPAGCRPACTWLALPAGTNNAPLLSDPHACCWARWPPCLLLSSRHWSHWACGMLWHNPSGHFGDIPPSGSVIKCPGSPGTERIPGMRDFQAKPRKALGKRTGWSLHPCRERSDLNSGSWGRSEGWSIDTWAFLQALETSNDYN